MNSLDGGGLEPRSKCDRARLSGLPSDTNGITSINSLSLSPPPGSLTCHIILFPAQWPLRTHTHPQEPERWRNSRSGRCSVRRSGWQRTGRFLVPFPTYLVCLSHHAFPGMYVVNYFIRAIWTVRNFLKWVNWCERWNYISISRMTGRLPNFPGL